MLSIKNYSGLGQILTLLTTAWFGFFVGRFGTEIELVMVLGIAYILGMYGIGVIDGIIIRHADNGGEA